MISSTTAARENGARRGGAILLLSLAAALVIYWPSLHFGFVYDDYFFVHPHSSAELWQAFVGSWYASDVVVPFYRPLTVAWYAARFELCHFNAQAYHTLSIALFSVVLGLCCVIVDRLVRSTRAALLAGIVVATHPGLPYSLVAWTTNQMHLLQTIVVLTD